MGNIYETKIDTFTGGITEDKRTKDYTKFSLTKNFDAFTYPHKLIPQYSTVADEVKAYKIVKFCAAPHLTDADYSLFGLGVAATTIPQFYQYDDLTHLTPGWIPTSAGSAGTNTNRNENIIFYYKGYIYCFGETNKLKRYDTTEAAPWNEAYQTIGTNLATCQPVHHPADDCAYFFADNKVYRLNNTTWDGLVLELPTNQYIASACAYGNYLALGCKTISTIDTKSTVYLWDRDSSLNTLTQRIDFGDGAIKYLFCLNNKLLAVMSCFATSLVGLLRGKILVKQASGDFAITLNQLVTDNNNIDLTHSSTLIKDDIFYCILNLELKGDTRYGIWGINEYGGMSLQFIEKEANDDYQGFFMTGNMWWIAHSSDGSVNRSSTAYSTTNPSIYESLVFATGDSDLSKKLIGVTVMTEPLPADGEVILKYRINGATSWTTIFDNTTDDSMSHGAINIEATGVNFPEYREIEFRIESYGGAVITGLKFKEEIIDRELY